jgi:hypothetical protein
MTTNFYNKPHPFWIDLAEKRKASTKKRKEAWRKSKQKRRLHDTRAR